jgi:hypothetical protein
MPKLFNVSWAAQLSQLNFVKDKTIELQQQFMV